MLISTVQHCHQEPRSHMGPTCLELAHQIQTSWPLFRNVLGGSSPSRRVEGLMSPYHVLGSDTREVYHGCASIAADLTLESL